MKFKGKKTQNKRTLLLLEKQFKFELQVDEKKKRNRKIVKCIK